MSDLKKDHPVGAGAGATSGAMTGAFIGAAAGPIGSAIGAIIGAVGGAKLGDSIAELVNPTDYDAYWHKEYSKREYVKPGYEWEDYAPAYGLGYHAKGKYRKDRYDDIEDQLESTWDEVKGKSRLAWSDAREAVRDGWHHIERALPGDADGDGR